MYFFIFFFSLSSTAPRPTAVFVSRIQHSVRSSRTCFKLFRVFFFLSFSFYLFFFHYSIILCFIFHLRLPSRRRKRSACLKRSVANEIYWRAIADFLSREQTTNYTQRDLDGIIRRLRACVGFVDFNRSRFLREILSLVHLAPMHPEFGDK